MKTGLIIVRLKGGLGNQLFQYAAGRALAARHKVELALDLNGFARDAATASTTQRNYALGAYHLRGRRATDTEIANFVRHDASFLERVWLASIRRVQRRQVWRESKPGWRQTFDSLGSNVYLEGYFQHPRYFSFVAGELKVDLRPNSLPEQVIIWGDKLRASDSVCVQVRRGDYVKNRIVAKRHGACSLDYYKTAWDLIIRERPNAHGYVFTDDEEWGAMLVGKIPKLSLVGPEWNGPEFIHKFYLMTCCRHHLIANSTFGWWAAWLGENKTQRVIAPREWWVGRDVTREASGMLPSSWFLL